MRRKTIKKNFWFSYDEDKQLKYLSSILNLSESNTIRKLLYETQVKECPPKEFYEAMGYCLSISDRQFYKLYKESNISMDDNNNYFVNIVYDEELGLILSEEESNIC